ncbi:MAG: hypothetical protein SOZ89_05195 [Peptoniphilaceae bacterium]|nr:hypothetical protein [Peptoniphilaceae bacterium]MDY3738501.1 hypothetical protein [Peptoniphilaceae bacterium]
MILISNKAKKEVLNFLDNNNIEYVLSINNPKLNNNISDHPDLSVFVVDNKNIIVSENVFEYYKYKFRNKNIKIIKGELPSCKYPYDSIYNVVKFKNFLIHGKIIEKNIFNLCKDHENIIVKQGYTRCSVIPLKNTILTSDYGIYKKINKKINTILLPIEEIKIDGYENGFIGGTCGFVDDNTFFFTGDITNLKSYDIIRKTAEKEKIKIIYPKTEITDLGSILKIGD